jgi:hypothetical protein
MEPRPAIAVANVPERRRQEWARRSVGRPGAGGRCGSSVVAVFGRSGSSVVAGFGRSGVPIAAVSLGAAVCQWLRSVSPRSELRRRRNRHWRRSGRVPEQVDDGALGIAAVDADIEDAAGACETSSRNRAFASGPESIMSSRSMLSVVPLLPKY